MIFYIINKVNILLVCQGPIHKANLSYPSYPCRKNVGKNDKISNDFKKILIWATSFKDKTCPLLYTPCSMKGLLFPNEVY
jgi:hypothetical protein